MKPEGAVGPGSERGSEHDDEHDDDDLEDAADDSLRAMRSVWLSMRDEEPGEGGLSALLAAAHAKAAEMRPPSVWQRIAVMLRRPPALAFATVLVLVGGAVVVSQQAKDEPSATMATGEEKATMRATASSTATVAPAAPVPAAATVVPAAPDPAAAAEASRSNDGYTAPPPAPVAMPDKPIAPKVAKPMATKKPARQQALSDDLDDNIRKTDETPQPAASAGMAAPAAEPAPPAMNRARGKVPDDALAALERKARTAADAGDCATVQQLLEEIGRRDAQARDRMAQRPSIQGCLIRAAAPASTK